LVLRTQSLSSPAVAAALVDSDALPSPTLPEGHAGIPTAAAATRPITHGLKARPSPLATGGRLSEASDGNPVVESSNVSPPPRQR